jgi:hypothetical protein
VPHACLSDRPVAALHALTTTHMSLQHQ